MAEAALQEARAQQAAELASLRDRAAREGAAVETIRLVPKRGDVEIAAIGIAWGFAAQVVQ